MLNPTGARKEAADEKITEAKHVDDKEEIEEELSFEHVEGEVQRVAQEKQSEQQPIEDEFKLDSSLYLTLGSKF